VAQELFEEQARLHALVRGRVQGVSFRYFVRRHARELELVGWVRNLPDRATVEVVAEGPRPNLEQLLQHLHAGPSRAQVQGVDAEWDAAQGQFNSFHVR